MRFHLWKNHGVDGPPRKGAEEPMDVMKSFCLVINRWVQYRSSYGVRFVLH